jgi:nucleoid DNA-binding protein
MIGYVAGGAFSMDCNAFDHEALVSQLAQRAGLSIEQARAFLQAQAQLVYACGPAGFPIPGLGRFVRVERPARRVKIHFGERAGDEIDVPPNRHLKFVVAPIAHDAAFQRASVPDVFALDWTLPHDESPAAQPAT